MKKLSDLNWDPDYDLGLLTMCPNEFFWVKMGTVYCKRSSERRIEKKEKFLKFLGAIQHFLPCVE